LIQDLFSPFMATTFLSKERPMHSLRSRAGFLLESLEIKRFNSFFTLSRASIAGPAPAFSARSLYPSSLEKIGASKAAPGSHLTKFSSLKIYPTFSGMTQALTSGKGLIPQDLLGHKIFGNQKYLSKVRLTVSEAENHVEKMEEGAGCLSAKREFQRRHFFKWIEGSRIATFRVGEKFLSMLSFERKHVAVKAK